MRFFIFILLTFFVMTDAYAQFPVPEGAIFHEGEVRKAREDIFGDEEEDKNKAMQTLERSRDRLRRGEYPSLRDENAMPNPNDRMDPRHDEMLEREHRDRYMQNERAENAYAPPLTRGDPRNAGDGSVDDRVKRSPEILYFFSFIEIQSDGKILVTDTIKLGKNSTYKNGFERNFPLSYRNSSGDIIHNSVNVLSASFNGNELNFNTSIKDDNIIASLDYSPDYFTEDINTIVISYRIGDVLTFKDGQTEFFLEMFGKGWDRRILNLGAAIIFVKGTEVYEKIAFITDKPNSVSFKVAEDDEKNIGFVADRILEPGEGFSIYLKWKDGVINSLLSQYSLDILLEKYGLLICCLGAILLLAIYYILLPFFVKKDKDFFVKRINSLRSLSPAALRYILRKRFDPKMNVVSILDMVIKSNSEIKEFDGSLEIDSNLKGQKKLSKINKFLFTRLFSKKNRILSFQGKDKNKLKKLNKNISFLAIFETELFFIKQNIKFILIALTFSLFSLIGGAFMSLHPVYIGGFGLLAIISCFICLFASYLFIKLVKRLKMAVINRFVFIGVVAVVSLLLGGFAIYKIGTAVGYYNSFILIVMPIMSLCVHIVFKASANTARYIHDSFSAFKNYLTTSVQAPSEKTLWSAFDKFLPYALALDIESEYNDRYFKDGQKIPDDCVAYLPVKYKTSSLAVDVAAEMDKLVN